MLAHNVAPLFWHCFPLTIASLLHAFTRSTTNSNVSRTSPRARNFAAAATTAGTPGSPSVWLTVWVSVYVPGVGHVCLVLLLWLWAMWEAKAEGTFDCDVIAWV